MADRFLLSNDSLTSAQIPGYQHDEETFYAFPLANESSVHPASANTLVPIGGPMKANGRVVDFFIGVVQPACSASGFVSGSISATLNINSATCMSTVPAVVAPALSANIVRGATNLAPNSAFISGVVNVNSANFSTGDQLSFNWTTQSGGSAAAGAAGKGLVVGMKVRYAAR